MLYITQHKNINLFCISTEIAQAKSDIAKSARAACDCCPTAQARKNIYEETMLSFVFKASELLRIYFMFDY